MALAHVSRLGPVIDTLGRPALVKAWPEMTSVQAVTSPPHPVAKLNGRHVAIWLQVAEA
jgi:hypothetical protein